MPALSILLPCRDAGDHLDPAIASIRDQTFGDYEVIAIDDASTDDTFARLYTWAQADGRVRVVRGRGAGIAAALATGLAAARGGLVARMDADDIAEPDRLARQHDLMADDPALAACGTGVRYFPPEAVQGGARRYEEWINGLVTGDDIARDIFVECPIAHPTLVIRRSVLTGVGGYRDMGWPEDYDLVLRVWAAGFRMAKVPDILYHWRERSDRASRTDPRYSEDAFRRAKVHFLVRTLLAGGRHAVVWGAGPVGKAMALALQDAGVTVDAFVELSPRKVGQEIHGAPVVAPDAVPRFAGPSSAGQALVLAAVGQEGARHQIRDACAALGLIEGTDLVAVA